jgi:hypothetical protein
VKNASENFRKLFVAGFAVIAATVALSMAPTSTPDACAQGTKEPPAKKSEAAPKSETQSSTAPQAKPQLVTGTRILIVPPTGFVQSPTFSGFVDPNGKTSILVTELPAPFSTLTEGFSGDKLATRAIKLLDKQDQKFAGYPGLLLHVAQSLSGHDFKKWITVFGDEKESVMITATIPSSHPDFDKFSDSLKQIVMHPVWKRDVQVDKLANLLFSVEPTAPFKLAERIQNSLLYTLDGKIPQPSADGPLYIVGQSFGVTAPPDKKGFALKRLKSTAYMLDIKEQSVKPIVISDVQGYQIKASAIDAKTKEPMHLCQTLLFGERCYYIVQAITRKDKLASYEKAFDKMTQSIKLKP